MALRLNRPASCQDGTIFFLTIIIRVPELSRKDACKGKTLNVLQVLLFDQLIRIKGRSDFDQFVDMIPDRLFFL